MSFLYKRSSWYSLGISRVGFSWKSYLSLTLPFTTAAMLYHNQTEVFKIQHKISKKKLDPHNCSVTDTVMRSGKWIHITWLEHYGYFDNTSWMLFLSLGTSSAPPPLYVNCACTSLLCNFAFCCNDGHQGVAPIDVHPAVAVNQPAAPDECCFLCQQ